MNEPLTCQRHLFPEKAVAGYLNGASRAPQLHAVAAAGRAALAWREENSGMPIPAFFEPVEALKNTFAKLLGATEVERVALIPSVSYGVATVAKNLPLARGQNIIVVEDQFPSNVYAWAEKCKKTGAELRTVPRPAAGSPASWQERVLAAIDARTATVAIANVHWADGSLFDLVGLRERTDAVGAWLVVDATQSLGALPFDLSAIRPDAVIAAGYKWLMGPYGCAYAWYGPRLDGGKPLEENWINRAGSEDFRNLLHYREEYRPLANRYSVGEHSNFLMTPMQRAGLEQVLAWDPARIQTYCAGLWATVETELLALGVSLPAQRAQHLVGLRLPAHCSGERLAQELSRRNLQVSYRGDAVRVSPNVYTTPAEMQEFLAAVTASIVR
ncbi:aminotransferase class V-fold PLP-dependent enzyme [Neolewinella lacunae]|uniref:Aminotransferase class V-fold PLP-dependent enzyme n=1 Tax=Neolewinella lacunae TaxID=1517758 RepID=A0A923PI03_9BACT|nr:aminotransferase class V-fold PLP-dependent enzyme [Neolewinella lacunae]MBC6994493.1 aminotransferase class V-fold PLP-dependent enzyme [Neolewinella lacunae]MDN3634186.1 aminotransferase class V-fold PLP-dependent enzyme [Neolewinella lacunae]